MSWNEPLAGHPRYEFVRNLGRGSHSLVQLCRDRATGEAVAVKLIQRGWDPGQSKYVERELLNHQELSRTRHPHIVEFREVFLTSSHLAVVMEYVEGENLQQFLANTGGRASEALARFLFQQLVLALDFCHRKGKVSRDVKLANTLLALAQNQLPLVKLCDFGFSKDTMLHSAPASQVGTALFVAPEVMHNFSNQPYDGALADVWSCGIVLFILLFGRHPFLRPEDVGAPDQQQMLTLFTRTAREEFSMLPHEAGAISPECADLLLRMLQTRPALRLTMSAIQVHPWFRTGLPEGAGVMNTLILRDDAAVIPRQSPDEIRLLVKQASHLDPMMLSGRFGNALSQQQQLAMQQELQAQEQQQLQQQQLQQQQEQQRQQQQQEQHRQQQLGYLFSQPPQQQPTAYAAASDSSSAAQLTQQQQIREQQQQRQQQWAAGPPASQPPWAAPSPPSQQQWGAGEGAACLPPHQQQQWAAPSPTSHQQQSVQSVQQHQHQQQQQQQQQFQQQQWGGAAPQQPQQQPQQQPPPAAGPPTAQRAPTAGELAVARLRTSDLDSFMGTDVPIDAAV
ncbi:hypothetical protein MNEG_12611 [Monoraphidium neglectum]|uniref:Protein kinase domain-containing protein n=1 Tax=Monoraphidium neglectum TaxID=145388 RepID=A0A0D2J640_9CHLO|nr:hypothetical protein MNEG_12611 [Monoraphidium neglectum]KIY95352.1 hypothetical protein MNEG_12611 [Monoraphidium neglectum]|eukprot:XP_013894372.1 hypothetical protein MNEG_12611 [Monoraphidium neglectum]